MGNFPTYLGNSIVVESGVAVLGQDDESLTVDIRGLKFERAAGAVVKAPPRYLSKKKAKSKEKRPASSSR